MYMPNTSELENVFFTMGFDQVQSILSTVVSLAGFIMLALGLYTIAKRRGIRNPWLAWIPFGQGWMLGCVSDQYQHVSRGRKKNKRSLLVWLEIANTVLAVVTIILLVKAMLVILRYVDIDAVMQYSQQYIYVDAFENLSDAQLMEIASAMMGMMLPAFMMLGVSILLMVFKFMAIYDLFRSCEPNSATAYTLVSIFLGSIALGVLTLLCRNKDFGMKPQQYYGYQQPGQLPPEQNWQPPQDPWQNNHPQW